jgi:hypothetical protein
MEVVSTQPLCSHHSVSIRSEIRLGDSFCLSLGKVVGPFTVMRPRK